MARKPANHSVRAASCLSQKQVQALLAHIERRADEARRNGASRAVVDEIIVLALLHGGLRAQELCALQIADTPADHGKPELRVRDISGASARVVSLPGQLVPVFQRFVQLHRRGARPSDALLLSERGTPFGYMSLYSKVRRIGQEAGVTPLHPATLRRTFLMRLFERERDLRLVQEQAGYASIKSTAAVVHPRPAVARCDACDKPMSSGCGVRIDSGQLLCPACLRDLRNR